MENKEVEEMEEKRAGVEVRSKKVVIEEEEEDKRENSTRVGTGIQMIR